MGYKDDRWLEAPGYCVECGNLRPLNKSVVCQECWWDHEILGEYWEEDADRSLIYYERLKKQD